MSAAPAWMKRLARDNARLYPRNGDAAGFAVWAGPDRRRRPLAQVRDVEISQALATGMLEQIQGGYTLSAAGRAALRRQEGGADYAAQHRRMSTRTIPDARGISKIVHVNLDENPLTRWRHYLDLVEIQAGDQFRADYFRSSLSQRVTRNWSLTALQACSPGRHTSEDAAIGAVAAKQRIRCALDCLGTGMGQVVLAVCIHEEGMGALERRFGWVERSGKSFLKLALQRLAEHYKI